MEHDLTTQTPTKRCADCGTPMSADSKRVECRHCEKCAWPTKCSHNHDQWPKQ
ncbi:hypothetical protein [Streptomyces sp. NBC_00063]|uniref:hypothetical protein n=1 Tax=Streptomyces sp. NBC_00063 TaxID=2975638 RepID=UPI003D72EFBA